MGKISFAPTKNCQLLQKKVNFLAKKARKALLQFECLTWWEKLRTFSYSWVMIRQTFSFLHCISTLLIWCCRVCYFAWWTRVSWGHHATLVYIEKMGPSKDCASRPLKASSGSAWVQLYSNFTYIKSKQKSYCLILFVSFGSYTASQQQCTKLHIIKNFVKDTAVLTPGCFLASRD